MAMFSFDCPDEGSILASELSALVQIIGIRSRQPSFLGTPNIAALLVSFFWRSSSTRYSSLLFQQKLEG